MLCPHQFRQERNPREQKVAKRERYIRADPIGLSKTRHRLKLDTLKEISPCVHSCTLESLQWTAFALLRSYCTLKLKGQLLKSIYNFCVVCKTLWRCFSHFGYTRESSFSPSSLFTPYRCIGVGLYTCCEQQKTRMALENFNGRGESSLHGGMQFHQNPNRFRISSKGGNKVVWQNSPNTVPTYECDVSKSMGPFVLSNVASLLNRPLSCIKRNVHCLKQ